MLDYFLLQGYVKMNEDGSVEKTKDCPEILDFYEDENGVIKFHYKHPIYGAFNEPDDWEDSGGWIPEDKPFIYVVEINPNSGTQVLNQS